MCEAGLIIAGIGIAAGIGSTAVGYTTQREHAKNVEEFQQRQYDATAASAKQALIRDYAALRERQQQESMKASQELQAIAQESRRGQATAQASALESGVTGLSIQGLLDDYVRQQSLFTVATQYQQRASQMQLYRSAQGAEAQAQNRILGAMPQPVAGPSALAAGLSAASTTASWLSLDSTREAFGLGAGPKAEVVTGTTGPLPFSERMG